MICYHCKIAATYLPDEEAARELHSHCRSFASGDKTRCDCGHQAVTYLNQQLATRTETPAADR